MPATPSRRGFLGLAASLGVGAGALAACSGPTSPSRPAGQNGAVNPKRIGYGPDSQQFGELSVPAHSTQPGVVVIVHGGFWQAQYTLSLGRPLAADLVARGYTCWNLEYRRIGDGGGWPATFEDVAAGIDHLTALDVDTSRVVAVGHSAGGQLAVWAAGRTGLPPGAPGAAPRVRLSGVVSQAGVLALADAARDGVGGSSAEQLVGGTPSRVPQRYELADPIERLPAPVPVLCVHSRDDANVPYAQSADYVTAATKAGGHTRLDTVEGDHFTLIDPTSAAWADVRAALPGLLAGRLPQH